LLTNPEPRDAYIAVHNRHHGLVAGYYFDRSVFPWIALWEENRARQYAPWNGITRVRGIEFGTSPMPHGLDQARKLGRLFDHAVLTSLPASSEVSTCYEMFVIPKVQ
jgi:hypothetical protein